MLPIVAPYLALAWVRIALAAALLAACFVGGCKVQSWRDEGRIQALRADLESVKVEHARAVEKAANAALSASERYRLQEQANQHRVKEAQDAQAKERAALLERAASADKRTARLLDQAAAFTCSATGGQAPGDPGAAADPRAAALGDILGPVLRDYLSTVRDAESLASDLRAMRAGWPRDQDSPQ